MTPRQFPVSSKKPEGEPKCWRRRAELPPGSSAGLSFACLKGLVRRFSFAYATPSPLLPNSIIRQCSGSFPPDSGLFLPRKGPPKPLWAAGSGAAAVLPACSAVFRTELWRCFADRRELASSLVILSNPQQISRQCQSSPALRDGSFHTLDKQASGRCCLLGTQVADWKPVPG